MIAAGTRQFVWQRAKGRCEYCHLPEEHAAVAPLHLEHIIARKHRGSDALNNLALACHQCNLHKGTNLASFDPDTGELTPLFNPRREVRGRSIVGY